MNASHSCTHNSQGENIFGFSHNKNNRRLSQYDGGNERPYSREYPTGVQDFSRIVSTQTYSEEWSTNVSNYGPFCRKMIQKENIGGVYVIPSYDSPFCEYIFIG